MACYHVYQVENSILCWPYDVSVTGHYINSRECYPHWAILIIWEKSMHRLLGMHVGGQSKDNSDLSGWLDNRQMSLISHRTGMHHMHLYALLGFELVLVCLIAKLFLTATWTICCSCYLLVLSLSVLPVCCSGVLHLRMNFGAELMIVLFDCVVGFWLRFSYKKGNVSDFWKIKHCFFEKVLNDYLLVFKRFIRQR